MLGRQPEEINLLEIIEAIDGPVVADVSLSPVATGKQGGRDVLETLCQDVAGHIRTQLASTTIARLMPQTTPLLKAG